MIAAELIDIENDRQLWGEHYNRELSDVFAVQEEIASEITEKLRLKLTGEDRRRLAKRFTENWPAQQVLCLLFCSPFIYSLTYSLHLLN